jgi:PEP-CTERM motif
MVCRKTWILGAALCGAVLCGANSQAGSITYLATGVFTTSGTSTFTNGAASVTDTAIVSMANVPPTTFANLGTFTTVNPGSTQISANDTFTVTIENILTTDTIKFSGTMSGSFSDASSSAFIQFSTPLTQTLDGFIFTIVSADGGTPGRVNLNAPMTNGGASTINATVAVPEPASVVLLGLAVPALAGLGYRRSRR